VCCRLCPKQGFGFSARPADPGIRKTNLQQDGRRKREVRCAVWYNLDFMDCVRCATCEAVRPLELIGSEQRARCPVCGGTSLSVSVSLTATVSVSATVTSELTPPGQERDWRQRWDQIRADLDKVIAARTDNPSRESIYAARYQLHSFYVQAYHLKDALKNYFRSIGSEPPRYRGCAGLAASKARDPSGAAFGS
jgi:hypothetical protein